ncbi:protein FAM184A-like [Lingula anatina]|uniref:Protein FAM184A-like n=1 Tax=Lingula anatina TaxID=7574 RepID=A0A1S3IWQ8_LINAN|nr:protein FAM184A-like [Lingula anatina]|eukprot:XP_013402625.1 protein FAM184A-like [Lingula anatina]
MASGAKMAHNFYQNGKYGTLPQTNPKDAEITQDMHLKMSKKIAQLTKVIYALNTKNDEHEAVIQSIKDHHEEEMQQLITETRVKLENYRTRMGGDVELKKKITALEALNAEHQQQKQQALEDFQNFKRRAEEREMQLKTEESQKVIQLSQEVLTIKKHFEEQLSKFDQVKADFESNQRTALENLKKVHAKELEDLRNAQSSQQSDLSKERERLEQLYSQQIDQLKGQIEELNGDKKKIADDYEDKLSKAKAFYDKELDVLRNAQNSDMESRISDLLAQQNKIKKDFAYQEGQFKKRIDDLIEQLSRSEDEIAKQKEQLQNYEKMIQDRSSDSDTLSRQLSDAKHETAQAITRLKEVEGELAASKERCSEQAADMLKKSTLLGQLEATRLQNEATIKDLESQLSKLKDRSAWLEKEREGLQNKTLSQEEEKNHQLKSLERSLEDLSLEKQALKERYERDLNSLEESHAKREKELQNNHEAEMMELKKMHKEELENQRKASTEMITQLKKENQDKIEALQKQHNEEITSMKAEYERVQGDLSHKLKTAEEEVRRLEKLVKESEQGLGSASSHIDSLKEASDKLKAELDSTKAELRAVSNQKSNLQAELEKLRAMHDTKMREAQLELKTKLDQLSKDLDAKWTDTLRKECLKLRSELTEQKEEDKRAALQQLAKMKDEEIAAAREGWERKVTQLLDEISMLKRNIDAKSSESSELLADLKQKAAAEEKRLRDQMNEAADEYAKKVEALERIHAEKIKNLEAQRIKEVEEMERTLTSKHMEEMSNTIKAQKALIESVKDQADKQRDQDLETQHKIHLSEKETLKSELAHRHAMELEQMNKAHNTQMNAARMELERAIELSKQKERDFEIRSTELQEEVRHREKHISNLEAEIRQVQEGLDQMRREVEFKGKEILKIRSEANQQLRKREEQLAQQHEEQVNSLSADHLRETQDMLGEFNRAQDLLKDKISALQIMLEEAEDNYRNRESRPEDLEMIKQLQKALEDREEYMKRLEDEKKYYQLELVNRETNFNKVFNTQPNVGVLNPFMKPKKKGDKGPTKYTSSPSLNRLQPLPGSPVHEEKLNPIKPLPPTAVKKFMV